MLTEDGYLLTLNRIPGPKNAPPVLLHHGFSSTSMDWLASGKNKALGALFFFLFLMILWDLEKTL